MVPDVLDELFTDGVSHRWEEISVTPLVLDELLTRPSYVRHEVVNGLSAT